MRRAPYVLLCIALTACTRAGGGYGASGGAIDYTQTQPATTARVNSWTRPHVLRFTGAENIETLNPTLNSQGVMLYLSQMTMAWLIRWNHENQPEPELATQVPTQEDGGVSKDGLTITYHIRKGVKWSDGAPFDADDVVFSFHAVLNPANNVLSRTGWDDIAGIDEPDKYTVILHMKKPYSPFLETFFSTAGANPCLMPKHILGGMPNINNAAYNSLPVGIGPFKYKEWKRGDRVVMVANPLYWRGRPKLDEIDYVIVENPNTVGTMLESHTLDLWYPTPGSRFVVDLQKLPGFAYIRQPGYLFNHLDFNVTRPGLSDPVVRRALRYATNRDTFIQKIGHGVGIRQEEPAPKTSAYWDPTIPLTPFDIAKANQLLDADGWTRGRDGIRTKNGVRLNLQFVTNSQNPVADQTIELIGQWWKQIGVGVSEKTYDSSLLFANNGPLYKGTWDIAFFAWGVGATGDLSALYACDQIPPNGQNLLRWCNPRADAAMKDLYKQYGQAGKNRDDHILFQALDQDVPMIVLNGREDIFFFNQDLRNFHPNGVSPFDDMENVDI